MLKLLVILLSVSLIQADWTSTTDGDPIEDVVQFVQKTLNARSNSILYSKVSTVTQSVKNYMHGWNYKIDFGFSQTTCRKYEAKVDSNGCKAISGRVQNCVATVIYHEIVGDKELVNFHCGGMAKRAGGVSGPVKDPEIYMDTLTRVMASSNALLTNVKLVSVRTQVVAGMKYFMSITADNSEGKRTSCDIIVWSRPWIPGQLGFQVKQFSCGKDVTFKGVDVRALGQVTGGINEVSDFKEYRDTALRALSMSNAYLKNERLVSVSTQVVSGTMIRMQVQGENYKGETVTCDISVWSRPWLDGGKEFQVPSFKCDKEFKAQSMEKRAGQISDPLANPEKYQNVLVRVMSQQNAYLRSMQIFSVRSQVVSGQLLYLKVGGVNANGESTSCDINVWSRPWVKGEEGFKTTKFECDKDVSTKIIEKRAGQISDPLPNPEKYQNVLVRVMSQQNAYLRGMQILSVRSQIVSGQILYLKVGGVNANGESTSCDINVWSRPWVKGEEGFKTTKFVCDKDVSTKIKVGELTKRDECPGCVSGDLDNPDQYMGLYIRAYSMAKTNTDINNIRIISVRTQVVAGTKYYMIVETTEAGDQMKCDVQFVVTPWETPDMELLKFDCAPY